MTNSNFVTLLRCNFCIKHSDICSWECFSAEQVMVHSYPIKACILGREFTAKWYVASMLTRGFYPSYSRGVLISSYLYKWLTRGLTPREFIQFLKVRSSLVSPRLRRIGYFCSHRTNLTYDLILTEENAIKMKGRIKQTLPHGGCYSACCFFFPHLISISTL